eukprot:m.126394 g.126394  ORF g.126394 m.126394 type:complete len:72 (-) comp9706_c1_seq4:269-484(-)
MLRKSPGWKPSPLRPRNEVPAAEAVSRPSSKQSKRVKPSTSDLAEAWKAEAARQAAHFSELDDFELAEEVV